MFRAVKKLFGVFFQRSAQKPYSQKHLPQDDFQNYLHGILQRKNKFTAGKIQVISLEKIRDHVQGDWNTFLKKAECVIEETIMKRLGPEDAFSKRGENDYIIMFDKLSQEDAEIQCVMIVQEIFRVLFGDRNVSDRVAIKSVAVAVDGHVDVKEIDLLDVIARLLNQEQNKLDQQSANGHLQTKPTELVLVDRKTGREESFDFDQIRAQLPDDLDFQYTPQWNTQHKMLSVYACHAVSSTQKNHAVLDGTDTQPVAALDYLAIQRITQDMEQLRSANSRVLMTCPVHLETLNDAAAFDTFAQLCRCIPEIGRRDLIFEIHGITNETESGQILQHTDTLRKLGRTVIVSTFLRSAKPERMANTGVHSLCFDMQQFQGSEKSAMRLMDGFAETTHRAGMKAVACGLDSLSLVTYAIGTGFDYIAGGAIHKDIAQPKFVHKFQTQSLLDQLVA